MEFNDWMTGQLEVGWTVGQQDDYLSATTLMLDGCWSVVKLMFSTFPWLSFSLSIYVGYTCNYLHAHLIEAWICIEDLRLKRLERNLVP